MATKDDKAENGEETKDVAKAAPTGLAALSASLEQDGQTYKENLGKDDITVPFLYMIQQMTPMANPAKKDVYDKAFIPGMFYDNVNMKPMEKLTLIFCHYSACYLEWKPGRAGFAGRHSVADGANIRTVYQEGDGGGDVIQEGASAGTPGNLLNFTHEHAVLVLDNETGAITECMLSLTSTQIKNSKKLNHAISKTVNASGVAMPRFYSVFEATSQVEEKGENSWFGWVFKPISNILDLGERAEKVYAAAKALADGMATGEKEIKYEKSEAVDSDPKPGEEIGDDEIPF